MSTKTFLQKVTNSAVTSIMPCFIVNIVPMYNIQSFTVFIRVYLDFERKKLPYFCLQQW